MKRRPAVAGKFYPGEPAALAAEVAKLFPDIPPEKKQQAIAVVSPHAGYFYSGAVAGETIARVRVPESVVILGPNHHGRGAPVALMAAGAWQMPMGDVPIDVTLAGLVAGKSTLITRDEQAHQFEHSLEVQVPFLQFAQKRLAIVPLVISHLSFAACREVGLAIAAAIREYGLPALIVASTDMTHYETREAASAKDLRAIEFIEKLDPEGLHRFVLANRI
ncbi:MAG: AmmeMemoRadiSam system protein B, partial [Deltaproteobacteria bacterium RIFOXYD12_FULL_57_12]